MQLAMIGLGRRGGNIVSNEFGGHAVQAA